VAPDRRVLSTKAAQTGLLAQRCACAMHNAEAVWAEPTATRTIRASSDLARNTTRHNAWAPVPVLPTIQGPASNEARGGAPGQ